MTSADWIVLTSFVIGCVVMFTITTLIWREVRRRQFVPANAIEAVRVCCKILELFPQPRVFFIRTETGMFLSSHSGKMVWGETPHAGACNVGWRDGWLFYESALAHELAHARLMRQGDPLAYGHDHPIYKPGGLVDDCNRALRRWEEPDTI